METAVAFLIFNRPETTVRVFEAIAEAKPAMLLVIADGPRPRSPRGYGKLQVDPGNYRSYRLAVRRENQLR